MNRPVRALMIVTLLIINEQADGNTRLFQPTEYPFQGPYGCHFPPRKPRCDKDTCAAVSCFDVRPCPPGTVFSSTGGGYCGCCPTCLKITDQDCDDDYCARVRCANVNCPPGTFYSPTGGGKCGCCPKCVEMRDPSACTPDFCARVFCAFQDKDSCPAGTVYSPSATACGCCPGCLNITDYSQCPQDICERIKIKCPAVEHCPPGTVYSSRGGGYCGCCPSCVEITNPPMGGYDFSM